MLLVLWNTRQRLGGDGVSRWYDRSGKPMGLDDWAIAYEDKDTRQVARDEVGTARVSTVWLGLDHNYVPGGPPLIFETMVFDDTQPAEDRADTMWRYSTEAEAIEGHAAVVAWLKGERGVSVVSIEMAHQYQLTHYAEPMLSNQAHQAHYRVIAAMRKEWRAAFAALASEAHVPNMERINITVDVERKTKRMVDTDAVSPSVKAAIDGLVDAGVIDDDTPTHVPSITYRAPTIGTGHHSLTLTIEESS